MVSEKNVLHYFSLLSFQWCHWQPMEASETDVSQPWQSVIMQEGVGELWMETHWDKDRKMQ